MGNKPRTKKSSKTKSTVIVLAIAAPLLTVALALVSAKLILGGTLKQESITAIACVIAGVVSLLCGFFAARRAPQKKLLWGIMAAGGYACALLLGNLLFFGEGYDGILPIVGCCLGCGILGSLTAAAKRKKYA